MPNLIEQFRVKVYADPRFNNNAERESCIAYQVEHSPRLTAEWKNVSRNDAHKKLPHYDPDLLDAACTLAHYGLAEVDYRPKRVERRRDPLTGIVNEIGLGCLCFVRGKFDKQGVA